MPQGPIFLMYSFFSFVPCLFLRTAATVLHWMSPYSLLLPPALCFLSSGLRYALTPFMEQNSPHIVQTSECCGRLDSRSLRAFSGLMESSICPFQSSALRRLDISRSHSIAPFTPFAMSAACAAILEAVTPSRTSSRYGRRRCSDGVT